VLTELLALLKKGRTYSTEEIAQLLHTGVPAVRAQLDYLERQGYVKRSPEQTGCGQRCSGCKGYGQDYVLPVMWELSE
jgi:predicted ArsR family transcriptional regulator